MTSLVRMHGSKYVCDEPVCVKGKCTVSHNTSSKSGWTVAAEKSASEKDVSEIVCRLFLAHYPTGWNSGSPAGKAGM